MADKRLLYLTAERLRAYGWKAGKLAAEASFEAGDQGVAEFARYLAGAPGALYYVVADVIEEDFFQENIPHVRGRDRRTLLGRKLAQRYRDTSLALTLSLGMQEGARREERILFSSFTNTQQFQPWLGALKSSEARLVGVYSLALIAPLLAKRLKLAPQRYVLVSVQEGGMRQSYVEDGKVRFSRLGRVGDPEPGAVAQACAAESNRILQYLVNLRILPRETGPVDVIALAPAAQRALYEAAWGDNPRLKLNLVDIESASRTTGLKSAPTTMLTEKLFLHVLATSQPAEQFASDALRRFFHVWRARLVLLSAGAAVCAFTLLLAGVRVMELTRTSGELQSEIQSEARVSQEYDRLQADFPKTPLPRETLKAAVGTAGTILGQSRSPDRFLAEISQALAAVPQVELERIDWSIRGEPGPRAAPDAPKPAAPPPPSKEAAKPAAAAGSFEVVEIAARINGIKGSDYKAINVIVEQFSAALRQRPGLNVIGTQTPFDAIREKPFSGEVGEEDRTEQPTFTLRLSRRIET